MSIVLLGSTSGSITLSEPAVAGTNTLSLPAVTGTFVIAGQNSAVTAGTAVSASSTSVDFTSIPSWVKRITVMFSGVSTSGTSNYLVQIGAGSVTTSGYTSGAYSVDGTNATGISTSTAGFLALRVVTAAGAFSGNIVITNITGNTWVESGNLIATFNGFGSASSGNLALGGTLDRVRITTVNGTDTFDAGTINILYE